MFFLYTDVPSFLSGGFDEVRLRRGSVLVERNGMVPAPNERVKIRKEPCCRYSGVGDSRAFPPIGRVESVLVAWVLDGSWDVHASPILYCKGEVRYMLWYKKDLFGDGTCFG